MGRLAGGIVSIAVIVAIVWYRTSARDAANDDIESQIGICQQRIVAILESEKGFDRFGAKTAAACEQAHDAALALSYSAGGRRSLPKFDSRKYATAFGEQIVNIGKLGRQDRDYDQFLRQFQVDIDAAVKAGKFDADNLVE